MTGRSDAPASSAEYPRSVWRCTTNRKVVAPSAAYTANVTAFAPENWRERNIDSGTIGDAFRRSTTRKVARATIPRPSAATGRDPHPRSGPSMSANTMPPSPSAISTAPAPSTLPRTVEHAHLRDVPAGDPPCDRRDRQVEEEHCSPRHRVDEHTTEKRTDRHRDAAEPGPPPDRPTPLVGRERRRDDRQASGNEQRPGDALQPRERRSAARRSGRSRRPRTTTAKATTPISKTLRLPYRSPRDPPTTRTAPSVSR